MKPPDHTKKKTRSHGQPVVCLPPDQFKTMQRMLSQIPSILKNVQTNRELLLLILKQQILEDKKLVLDKTYMLKNCSINNLQITSSGKNLMSFEASGQNEDQFDSDQDNPFGGFGDTPPIIGDDCVQMDDHDPCGSGFAPFPTNMGSEPVSGETAAACSLPVQAVTDGGQQLANASDYDSGVSDCDSFVDDFSVASLSDVCSDGDVSDDDAASVMEDSAIVSSVCEMEMIDDGGQLGADITSTLINPHVHAAIGSVGCTGGYINRGVKGIYNVATGPPVPESSPAEEGISPLDSDLCNLNTGMPSVTASVMTPKVYETSCTPMTVMKQQATFPGLFLEICSGKYRMVVLANIFEAVQVRVLKKERAEVENAKFLSHVWRKANFNGFKPIYSLQFPVFVSTSRASQLDMYMYLSMPIENRRVGYSCQSCTLVPSRSLTEGNVVDVVVECSYKGDDDDRKRSPATAKSVRGGEAADRGLQEEKDTGEMKADVDSGSKTLAISFACPDFRGLQGATGQMGRETNSDGTDKKTAEKKGNTNWLKASNKSRNHTTPTLPYTSDFSSPIKVPSVRNQQGGFKTSGINTCRIAAPINKPDQSVAGITSHCSIDAFSGASWRGTFGDIRLVMSRRRDKNKKDKKEICSTEVKDYVHETCGTEGCPQLVYAGHGELNALAYCPDQAGQGDEKWQQIQNLSISLATERTAVEKHAGQKSFPYLHGRLTGCGSKQRSAYFRACGKKTLRCKTDKSGHRIHKHYGHHSREQDHNKGPKRHGTYH